MDENGLTEYGQVGAPAGTGLSDRRLPPDEGNVVDFIHGYLFDDEGGWHNMGGHTEDYVLCDKCEVELPDGTALAYMPRIAVVVPDMRFIDRESDKAVVEFASGPGGELLGMIIRFACVRRWNEVVEYRRSGRGDAASALMNNNHLEHQHVWLAWKSTDTVYSDRFRSLARAMHGSAKAYAGKEPYKRISRAAYAVPVWMSNAWFDQP